MQLKSLQEDDEECSDDHDQEDDNNILNQLSSYILRTLHPFYISMR